MSHRKPVMYQGSHSNCARSKSMEQTLAIQLYSMSVLLKQIILAHQIFKVNLKKLSKIINNECSATFQISISNI